MISDMKRFYLFFTGDPGSLLASLQKESIVEIDRFPEDFGFLSGPEGAPDLENKIGQVRYLADLLRETEGKAFSGRMVITEEEDRDIVRSFPLQELYSRFSSISGERDRRARICERIRGLKAELDAAISMDFSPLDLYGMRNFGFCLFGLDKKSGYSPSEIAGFKAEKTGETRKSIFMLVVFHKDSREKVFSEIERIKGTPVTLRKWNVKPSVAMERLDALLVKNEDAKRKKEDELKELGKYRNALFVYHDHLESLSAFYGAMNKFGRMKFSGGFAGWVRDKDIQRLISFVNEFMPEAYLHLEEPEAGTDIPIALENSVAIEPFEVVTDLYGRPVYKNMDPTGPLSLFFIVSFAFCITDAAYGAILAIMALIFMKKFRFMPSVVKFMKLLLYGGIATVAMGIITGSWFGDLLSRLPGQWAAVKFLKSLIILDPLGGGNNTFIFLGWALLIGYVQIVWGLTLNVYNYVKSYGLKKSWEAVSLLAIQLLVGVMIAVIYLKQRFSLPACAVVVPVLLLAVSFGVLMVLKAREQKGIAMKLFWAFYGAYNVVAGNLLGDVLSYSRLFGLGLTTAVLGLVVNEMVFMSSGIPVAGYILAAILFIGGHIGNLMINLMGSYVHTSRLQYLEFFTKFFESGGRPFKPFSREARYTWIVKNK